MLWFERTIKRIVKSCNNNSILDVGAGSGGNSDIFRQKLKNTEFTALEAWEPYIDQYNLKSKYDLLVQEDVRFYTTDNKFGITLLGDIIQNMTRAEAVDVYNKLLKNSEYVVLSIPTIKPSQAETPQNPYEKLVVEDWSHNEVINTFSNIELDYIEDNKYIFIGVNPELHTKKELLDALKPTYAVYGIYNDEEKFISKFLNSVKDADEIVLCDTGSKDNTNNIINEFVQSNPDVNLKTFKIHVSPWRFDDARNAAMSLIDGENDICISLDIDEYLMEGWREILDSRYHMNFTRYYHKFKTLWPGGGFAAHWHDRIHNRLGYAWRLPVHEILEYKSEEKICWIDDFWIYHEPDTEKSRSSYLPLLEQSVKERPDIWKSWTFLANEYKGSGRYEDALNAVDKAFEIKDSDKGYIYKFKYFLYREQGNVDMALLCLNNTIANLPGRREPYFEKGYYLNDIGRNKEAYYALLEAKKLTNRVTDYHYNPCAWDEEFDKLFNKVSELAKKEGLNI